MSTYLVDRAAVDAFLRRLPVLLWEEVDHRHRAEQLFRSWVDLNADGLSGEIFAGARAQKRDGVCSGLAELVFGIVCKYSTRATAGAAEKRFFFCALGTCTCLQNTHP